MFCLDIHKRSRKTIIWVLFGYVVGRLQACISPLRGGREKGEERQRCNLEEEEDRGLASRRVNGPISQEERCCWIASKKDYWRSLPYKDFGSTAQKIWLQVVAVPPEMATPETFHLFAPRLTSHFIPPWRARLFTSQNSPINFFCNFIFSHLGEDSYGERWSEKRMKSLGTLPPILIPSPLFQNPTAGDHGGPAYMGRV